MEEIGSSSLDGLNVIDLSTVAAAPSVGQILGDHGADVIKIEPPNGDETRRMGPLVQQTNPQFIGMNRNKRGMAMDLSTKLGKEILFKLLANADILIENFKPGTLEKWGMGYQDTLANRFPHLIHCRITGFGATGPLGGLPGYDGIGQAFGGLISLNGEKGGNPIRIPIPQADLITGLYAATGVLAALEERVHSGLGQLIEVSLMDTAISLLYPHNINWLINKIPPKRTGNDDLAYSPHTLIKTEEGYFFAGHFCNHQFEQCCKVLSCTQLLEEARFSTEELRIKNRSALTAALTTALSGYPPRHISDQLLAAGVPVSAVQTVPEVFDHPQVTERKMILKQGKHFKAIGLPIKLSRTPGRLKLLPPLLGEHNGEVLRSLDYSDDEIRTLFQTNIIFGEKATSCDEVITPQRHKHMQQSKRASKKALDGLCVANCTSHLSGALATRILRDLDAHVISVELTGNTKNHDDPLTRIAQSDNDRVRLSKNRSADRTQLRALLEYADIFFEDETTQLCSNWGMDDDFLKTHYPKLIRSTISPFGHTGPLVNAPGDEGVLQAFTGMMALNGDPQGAPLLIPNPLSSTATGLMIAIGALLALYARHTSQQGQTVQCAQLDATLTLQNPFGPDWLIAGVEPRRLGNKHPNAVPYDFYETKNGTIMLLVANDKQFRTLSDVLDMPELASDSRFSQSAHRIKHPEELGAIIETRLADKDRDSLVMTLLKAGVPAAPILTAEEALDHPHTLARGMVTHSRNHHIALGSPIKMSRTPIGPWKIALGSTANLHG
ncbi:MAG: CoA transferase [Gammaproteobacteria bacterium]|nr:CoA transferase [Gammaproteobacteria bacterium]